MLEFAYLDPGTGSIVIQAVIGTAVGALYAFRHFSRRLFKFGRFTQRKDTEADTE